MKMNDRTPLYLGFDIGGSSVKWGYGNCQQGVLRFESTAITSKDLPCLMSVFSQILFRVDSDIGLSSIRGIGIGTPGTIDRLSGKIHGTNPNLPFWTDLCPAMLIPSETAIPVVYDNDANLMALGEATLREGIGDLIGITVGSGIGSGFAWGGRLFHGAHGYGMEFGHVTVVRDGEVCNCGRPGCLEAYASVDGIKRRASRLKEYPEAGSWDLRDLLKLAQQDERLRELIQEGEHYLALALTDLTVLLDPQLIVLGGGGIDGKLYSPQKIEDLIRARLPRVNQPFIRVETAKAGNQAGVLGAIAYAASELSGT